MSDTRGPIDNPYPGLRPFRADENHLFFGRDEQRTELLGRLRKSRFLAVVGPSGSGKSSLVKAGLLPGLFGGFMAGGASRWRIVDTRPAGDPIGRLASALDASDALNSDGEEEELSFTEASLRRTSLGLVNVIKEARLPEGEKVLVLVDQFEELFRFIDTAKSNQAIDDASAFIKLLLAAVQQDDLPIYVMLTMRSDFLGDCARFRGLPEAINNGQYLIPRLTRDQRREVITGPAIVSGASLSPTLVNRLLNDVGDTPDQLPILQHALMRTFHRWQTVRPDAEVIELEDYEAVGGMSSALSRHADSVFIGLTQNPDSEAGRRLELIAEKMFKCLTDASQGGRRVRRHAKLKDIALVAEASLEEVSTVVNAFRSPSNCFLMPPIAEELKPDSLIDISHESLIRNWGRLSNWVDEEGESAEQYKLLAQKAARHQRGEEDLLGLQAFRVASEWQEKQQPTRAWAERHDSSFDSVMAFLAKSKAKVQASIDAGERTRRIKRAFAISAFFVIVAPLMMMLFFFGVDTELEINDARFKAEFVESGRADKRLFDFYKAQLEPRVGPPVGDGEIAQVQFDPRIARAGELESYGADNHADLVSKYSEWSENRGQALLNLIWDIGLPVETLITAVNNSAGIDLQEYYGESLELGEIFGFLEQGEVVVSPLQLRRELLNTVWGRHTDFLQYSQKYPVLEPSDKWLFNVYTRSLDRQFEIDELTELKKPSAGTDFAKHAAIAKKAVSRAQRNRLHEILFGSAKDIQLSELEGMLEIHKYFELDRLPGSERAKETTAGQQLSIPGVDVNLEPLSAGVDQQASANSKSLTTRSLPWLEHFYGVSREKATMAKSAQNLEAERSYDAEHSQLEFYFEDEANIAINDYEDSIKGHEELYIQEQRDASFVWTVKKLIEILETTELSIDEQTLKNSLLEVQNNQIVTSLEPFQEQPFTIWDIFANEKSSVVKKVIFDFWHITLIALLWPMWAWKRRRDARNGKIIAAKVGVLRLGLAGLADVCVASVVAAVIAVFAGFTMALPIAVFKDTFQFGDGVVASMALIVGVPVFIYYLLIRDALKFRYRRSLGKILFELRPVVADGAEMTRKLSCRRNWRILIGVLAAWAIVFIVMYLLGFVLGFVLGFFQVDFSGETWVSVAIGLGFILFLAVLGWFERRGGQRTGTEVIDARSSDSANILQPN